MLLDALVSCLGEGAGARGRVALRAGGAFKGERLCREKRSWSRWGLPFKNDAQGELFKMIVKEKAIE